MHALTPPPAPVAPPQTALHAQRTALVRQTWAMVQPIQAIAADLFYQRLFELDPALRPLFKRDLAAQGRMLMAALDSVVGSLDRPAELLPMAERLAVRHVDYGVRPQHYDTVGAALLWTLAKGLGEVFTPAVREAWEGAYGELTAVMKNAAYGQIESPT